MRVVRISRLSFKVGEGRALDLHVPIELNQDSVRLINFRDYSVWLVRPNREIAEAEFCTVCLPGGETVGYIIPGAAILSSDNPNNTNRIHGAYSLIVAAHVCERARAGDYSLVDHRYETANNPAGVFSQDHFYLVVWKSKLPYSEHFASRYAISLASAGLIICSGERAPNYLPTEFAPISRRINLRPTPTKYPAHISIILTKLIPFTESPVLRFFYLYQIIEHLMAEVYDAKLNELRAQLTTPMPPSMGDMKDWLNAFSSATNEDARIKDVLSHSCPDLTLMLEKLLDSIGVDRTKFIFPQMVYKLRNVLFHEYSRVHDREVEIDEISNKLYEYLLDRKIAVS
jgi:hypothetical protein